MSTDIREWAAAEGIDVNARGPISKKIREQYNEAHGVEPELEVDTDMVVDEGEPGGPTSREKPPTTRKSRWLLKGRRAETSTRKARASTDRMWASAWQGLSYLVGNFGAVPTARVLSLQAPVAGVLLDRELKGTRLDRLVQPAARAFNKGSSIGSLVALPLVVHAVTLRPELYPALKPMMVEMLYRWAEIAAPEMEKIAARQAKRREQVGFDPEEMLAAIFAADVPDSPEGMEG